MEEDYFPEIPIFSEELINNCNENSNFEPIICELYKYVVIIACKINSIQIDSPGAFERPERHYAILQGLINRCARLMFGTLQLSTDWNSAESSSILLRCISESAIKAQWLILKNDELNFKKYLAGGLKADLKLKEEIENNIDDRNGDVQLIEKQMIESIENCISSSG